MPQNIFMIILFGDFYIRNYIMKKKQEKPVQSDLKKISKVTEKMVYFSVNLYNFF